MTEVYFGYGAQFYGESRYQSSPYQQNTQITFGIRARVVRAPVVSPPPIDTLGLGLARRFDFLQKILQEFTYLNKIEYNHGQNLDSVWGRLYNLPRMTGEDDDSYRARLQTYLGVLTGSGTIPVAREVLDKLIGISGGSEVDSSWPATVDISFNTITAMRNARNRSALLDSVLPGLFAAGITYTVSLPFADIGIRAAVLGFPEIYHSILAAAQSNQQITFGIDAIAAQMGEIAASIVAAVQVEHSINSKINSAVRGDRSIIIMSRAAIQGMPFVESSILAAVCTNRSRPFGQNATVMGTPEIEFVQKAAIQKIFEMKCNILAFCVLVGHVDIIQKAAVKSTRQIPVRIRARVTKAL